MPGTDPKKTADQKMAELAPEYFAELMTQFVQKTDLTARQKIRRKIKGLLDIFSADTIWPKPHEDLGARRPARDMGDYLGAGRVGLGQAAMGGAPRQPAADDLAEPPALGAIPAPGAGVAADMQMGA